MSTLFLYQIEQKIAFPIRGAAENSKKKPSKNLPLESVYKNMWLHSLRPLVNSCRSTNNNTNNEKRTNKNMKNTTAFQLFYVNPKIK